MKKRGSNEPRVYFCHRCEQLLGSNRYLYVKTSLGNIAFCERCVLLGYKELINLKHKSEEIKKILKDFKTFLDKFKIGVDS